MINLQAQGIVPILFPKENCLACNVINTLFVESINYSNNLKILKCILPISRFLFFFFTV